LGEFVTGKIRETGILCPECEVPLIHIPRPIADDVVVCPDCGAAGDYVEVAEKGGNLARPKMPLDQLRALLVQYGFARK
jgi:uncharacterized Zn finger protein (UPF0148 family)